MRHNHKLLIILTIAVVLACIGGVVWAKAIYVPPIVHPTPTGFITLDGGGFLTLDGLGKLSCSGPCP